MNNENHSNVVPEAEFNETGAIRDAKALGMPKLITLGVQHTFTMFGATVLVPIITGFNISVALFMAGIGTLLFHLITKGKMPAFLGSSFAFIAPSLQLLKCMVWNTLRAVLLLPVWSISC